MGVLSYLLVLSCIFAVASSTTLADMDYGGVPLWIDRLLGEPSVMSLRGRLDAAWYRATNPQPCPQRCDCPIQWPTALYCDHRSLEDLPEPLPARTQYLFLQVGKSLHRSSSILYLRPSYFHYLLYRETTSPPSPPRFWQTSPDYTGSFWTTTF